jgi:hypothetical protein
MTISSAGDIILNRSFIFELLPFVVTMSLRRAASKGATELHQQLIRTYRQREIFPPAVWLFSECRVRS